MTQSKFFCSTETPPCCRNEHPHFERSLQPPRLRVLALALLDLQNCERLSPATRHYQACEVLITHSRSRLLRIQNHGQIVLCANQDGRIFQVAHALVPHTLATLEAIYIQAETLQWQRSTGEDPPEDWELHWQIQRIQAEEIAAIAQGLFIYKNIDFNPYQIFQTHLGLVLTRGSNDLVLIVREGYVWNYSTTSSDWEFFQSIRICQTSPV